MNRRDHDRDTPPKRVLLIGAGGLGSVLALALADDPRLALTVLDDDEVALSNLQRQILHRTSDIGKPKTASLHRLRRAVSAIAERLDGDNAARHLAGADLVLDGSDNFETRFLVNDTAVRLGIPYVFGGVQRFMGQVLPVVPGLSACYRCIFVEPPSDAAGLNCSAAGVLGAFVGVVGALQARAGLALLGLHGSPAQAGQLLTIDMVSGRWRRLLSDRRVDCTACRAGESSDG